VSSQTELTHDIGKCAVWPNLFVAGQENLYALQLHEACWNGLSAVEVMHCQTSTTYHCTDQGFRLHTTVVCKALYLQALDEVLLACLDNLVIFTRDVMLFAQAL